MATYELYVGGPGHVGPMYPGKTFDAAAPEFKAVTPASHKGPAQFGLTRVLDFATDRALQEFLTSNTVAATDKLGALLLPGKCILWGCMFEVVTPVAGLTLTPVTRVRGLTFPDIDCSTAAVWFAGPGGAKVTAGTPASIAAAGLATFDVAPDVLDLTVTALGAAKFGKLRLAITPLVSSFGHGER